MKLDYTKLGLHERLSCKHSLQKGMSTRCPLLKCTF